MDVVEMNADEEFVNILDRGSNTALFKQDLASGIVSAQETPEKVNELCTASTDVLKSVRAIFKTLSDQFATTRPTYDQLLAVMQPLMSDDYRHNGYDREDHIELLANNSPIGFKLENIALYRKMKSHTFGTAATPIDELPAGFAEGVWCTYNYRTNITQPRINAFVRETPGGPWKLHGNQNPFRSGGTVQAQSALWLRNRYFDGLQALSGLRFNTADNTDYALSRFGIDKFMVLNSALPDFTAPRLRQLGVARVLAPCCDVLVEPRNPVIGSRAFGDDPTRVAAQVAAAVAGLREGGVRTCLKHFPGHGGTAGDSHDQAVVAGAGALAGPFEAGFAAGADGLMVGHLAAGGGRSPEGLLRPPAPPLAVLLRETPLRGPPQPVLRGRRGGGERRHLRGGELHPGRADAGGDAGELLRPVGEMEGSAGLELRWADGGEERAEAARFLARVIAVDADYISHGEIAHGLSAEGVTWAPDLESRLVRELRDDGRACGVALARFEGALAGVASETWEAAGPAPHAPQAALAVDPTRRGGGLGAALGRPTRRKRGGAASGG